jgi:transcription elongation factor GreA
MTQITVTQEGLEKLQQEYNYLKNIRRKEVSEAIKEARGFGDLSENSEYDEAKTEQAKVESRIAELDDMLKRVVVISDEHLNTNSINVGSKVKVFNETFDEEVEYTIVGSTEAAPLQNKISDLSPIGKALIGHKKGDRVTVETPNGSMFINVLDITK